ncbi:hypothetical protein KFE25_005552 [Diacronema lutheri]|mgnify:FL=1|uniref:ribulose-phosphate 3-epimerase n=2 Tax=Diacronema lutheri TaxID=2081491 RepID=A0A8J6C907_DIALT|nr:hypothetical protein KFE25_005552 [Diacronema lutheri]
MLSTLLVVCSGLARSLVADSVRAARAPGRVVISPSVAKADMLNLGRECRDVVEAGAEWLHFSVQDGRMVPKISFGSPVVSALRAELPETIFDVKLGVVDPERRIDEFAKAGADILSVHPEATLQLAATLHEIDAAGMAPGVVLNPGTPISAIEHVLQHVDVIVVMLVSPGHGGPKYTDEACRKIRALRALCDERNVAPWIEVDGGVGVSNVRLLVDAGANALVAGGSIFNAADKRAALQELRAAAGEGAQAGHTRHTVSADGR